MTDDSTPAGAILPFLPVVAGPLPANPEGDVPVVQDGSPGMGPEPGTPACRRKAGSKSRQVEAILRERGYTVGRVRPDPLPVLLAIPSDSSPQLRVLVVRSRKSPVIAASVVQEFAPMLAIFRPAADGSQFRHELWVGGRHRDWTIYRVFPGGIWRAGYVPAG